MDKFLKHHLDSIHDTDMINFCEEGFISYSSICGFCLGMIPKLGYAVRIGHYGEILFSSKIAQEAIDKYKEICTSRKKELL